MLQRVLRDMGEVAMATGARDGREALALARQHRPEVLLVDIAVPPAGGVDLIREVVSILPGARILTVSAVADCDHAVLAAFRAGAIGHIDKETPADQIARLVTLAARGEPIVPRRFMPRLLAAWRMPLPRPAGDHPAP
jgi:DNA-binding NarL/FixJ family response regulator